MKQTAKQRQLKRQSRHRNQRRSRRMSKFQLAAIGVMVLCGGLAGGVTSYTDSIQKGVLAYATNVSHSGLLTYTNQNRTANSLAALSLDSRLNSAAQAKANDMVAKNYWSHTSPDGRQPWDFIVAAGYSYSMAGENLAYGALTSADTVQAWMNSPGHRANILKAGFTQVGFGFANSANFQNSGPQTVIVAMYAAPYAATPAPAPVTPKPAPAPAPKPAPAPAPVAPKPTPAPAPTQKTEPKKTVDKPAAPLAESTDKEEIEEIAAQPTQVEKNGEETVAPIASAEPVKRIEIVTGNYSGLAVAIALGAGVAAAGLFLYRHSKAWHRRIIKGEQFIIHHPLIDALAVMAVIVAVVLLQNVGQIL